MQLSFYKSKNRLCWDFLFDHVCLNDGRRRGFCATKGCTLAVAAQEVNQAIRSMLAMLPNIEYHEKSFRSTLHFSLCSVGQLFTEETISGKLNIILSNSVVHLKT